MFRTLDEFIITRLEIILAFLNDWFSISQKQVAMILILIYLSELLIHHKWIIFILVGVFLAPIPSLEDAERRKERRLSTSEFVLRSYCLLMCILDIFGVYAHPVFTEVFHMVAWQSFCLFLYVLACNVDGSRVKREL